MLSNLLVKVDIAVYNLVECNYYRIEWENKLAGGIPVILLSKFGNLSLSVNNHGVSFSFRYTQYKNIYGKYWSDIMDRDIIIAIFFLVC